MPPKARGRAATKAAAARKAGGRVLKRNTSDQVVSKALADNFRGWSEQDCWLRQVDGLTLAQRLKADLKRKAHGTLTVGALHYRQLKALYKPPCEARAVLVVPDVHENVNPQLVDAVEGLKPNPKRFGTMLTLLGGLQNINRTETVGLLRTVLGLSPLSAKHHPCCLAVMRMLARVRAKEHFPAELDVASAWMDKTMVEAWKADGRTGPIVFAKQHEDILKLIMPEADTMRECGHSTPRRLCDCSNISFRGSKLLSATQKRTNYSKFHQAGLTAKLNFHSATAPP